MYNREHITKLPKISSEIISEAKAALNSPLYVKPLTTNRPFTPRERVFFCHRRTNRPPSAFKLQHVQFQEKKKTSCTKLPALDNTKYSTANNLDCKQEIKRQTHSSSPSTTRRRSSSDVANNANISRKKMSSLSFPLSIDTLLKNHYEQNVYDHEYMSHENEINEARALCFDVHADCLWIISLIETKMKRKFETKEMCSLLNKLAMAIKRENLSVIRDENKKETILKTMFKLVNISPDDDLTVHILLVLLQMQVTGKYLATVCKLIFKISRLDKNDNLFLETNVLTLFVDILGLATPHEDAESLIYGYGALKFLTMNPDLMERAMNNGCLSLMLLHLKMINLERTERQVLPETINHVLYQLTGTLRNVVNDRKFYVELLSSGGLVTIYRALELFSGDIDVVTNISRILSIMSTDGKCCEALVDCWSNVSVLMSIIDKYPGQEEIVVRITYALGNILTNNENARHQLYKTHCSMGTFLNLMQLYLEKDLNNISRDIKFNVVEDVLIKIIRVIVNMSIQPEIGAKLVKAADDYHPIHKVKECEQFLDSLLTILRRKSIDENEELVLAALAALNNLSYYADMSNPNHGPFGARQLDITQALSLLLTTRNQFCKVEVARVFGNLTRSATVRDYLLETSGLLEVTNCLDSGDKELLVVCCGVLVNMTSDENNREAFKNYNGVSKMVNILRSSGEHNWSLSALICQTLWNVCSGSDHFPGDPMAVLDTLLKLTDEEQLFGELLSSDEEKVAEYKQWEDFASVATNLLEWLDELLEGRFDNVEQ
ncbi:armadillo repeat-containing protein 2 isoform X1 [Myzus persicae]|uniref:armadillo repeat-containing protein 2 isoform X1 n=2 Tax=Myzus persicae TaxID=13164 RepID=UPI000B93350B|nr:armadillo repeat-containing protein 2 isoform X1 [Myzus persicae]